MEEIEELKKIDGIYQDFDDKREKSRECDYRLTRLEMLRLRRTSRDSMIRLKPEKKVSRYRSIRKPS